MGDHAPSGGRRFGGGSSQSVREVVQKAQKKFESSSLSVVRGECRSHRKLGRKWTFDLATGDGRMTSVLRCEISAADALKIDSWLRRSDSAVNAALIVGNVLEVQGSLVLNDAGLLVFQVVKIAETFTRRGPMYLQDQATRKLLLSKGVSPDRVNGQSIHCSKQLLPSFPRTLNKVLVISPEDSDGLSDFRSEIQNLEKSLTVTYKTFRGASSAAPEYMAAMISEAAKGKFDLILIVRGGGSWESRRVYDHPAIAGAIADSIVPVATAIGHEKNSSMADRAARFSFNTPTAAGKALSTEMWKRSTKGQVARATGRSNQVSASGPASHHSWQHEKLQRDLAMARKEAADLKNVVASAFQTHVRDLFDLADRRVRLTSVGVSFLTVLLALTLIVRQNTLLGLLSVTPSLAASVLYNFAVLSGAALALRTQYQGRKSRTLRAAKDMRHPPADFDAWRAKIKKTVTVRKLRQLRRHLP
jgi:exonuclease VII large subunit